MIDLFRGWAQSLTLQSNQPSSGTYAISFNSSANFEGLQLALPAMFSFVNYNAIQFDIKGAESNLNYEIFLRDATVSPGRSQAVRGYTPSHTVTTSYQTAIVPFAVFHLDEATQFQSIVWQSVSNNLTG